MPSNFYNMIYYFTLGTSVESWLIFPSLAYVKLLCPVEAAFGWILIEVSHESRPICWSIETSLASKCHRETPGRQMRSR